MSHRSRILGALGMLTSVALLSAAPSIAGTLAQPSPAFAPDGLRSQVVRFGDLNLATSAGTRTLYRRIRQSAQQVCDARLGPYPAPGAAIVQCERTAIARAVADVGSARLHALHVEQSRHHGLRG
jgi:UrcA family protein